MLSARAYSLKQQSRLAISLSWIGGFTDLVALLALGTVVSHVTGTMTLLGRNIARADHAHSLFYALLLLAFLSGATLSAILTESAKRRGWRSKYILPIALEAALLAIAAIWMAQRGPTAAGLPLGLAALTALAMGLQNATITRISGAVVRTTHLTGIFTDLGLETIQYLFWYKDRLARRRWAALAGC